MLRNQIIFFIDLGYQVNTFNPNSVSIFIRERINFIEAEENLGITMHPHEPNAEQKIHSKKESFNFEMKRKKSVSILRCVPDYSKLRDLYINPQRPLPVQYLETR